MGPISIVRCPYLRGYLCVETNGLVSIESVENALYIIDVLNAGVSRAAFRKIVQGGRGGGANLKVDDFWGAIDVNR